MVGVCVGGGVNKVIFTVGMTYQRHLCVQFGLSRFKFCYNITSLGFIVLKQTVPYDYELLID